MNYREFKYLNLSKNPLSYLDCGNNPLVRYKRPLFVKPQVSCFVGYSTPVYKGLNETYEQIRDEVESKIDYFSIPFFDRAVLMTKYRSTNQNKLWKHIATILSAYKRGELVNPNFGNNEVPKLKFIEEWNSEYHSYRAMRMVEDSYAWKKIELKKAKLNTYEELPCYQCGATDYIWAMFLNTTEEYTISVWFRGDGTQGHKMIAICPHCKKQIYSIDR